MCQTLDSLGGSISKSARISRVKTSCFKSGKALEAVHEVDLAEVEASEMEVQSDGSDGSAEEPLDSDDRYELQRVT